MPGNDFSSPGLIPKIGKTTYRLAVCSNGRRVSAGLSTRSQTGGLQVARHARRPA